MARTSVSFRRTVAPVATRNFEVEHGRPLLASRFAPEGCPRRTASTTEDPCAAHAAVCPDTARGSGISGVCLAYVLVVLVEIVSFSNVLLLHIALYLLIEEKIVPTLRSTNQHL